MVEKINYQADSLQNKWVIKRYRDGVAFYLRPDNGWDLDVCSAWVGSEREARTLALTYFSATAVSIEETLK